MLGGVFICYRREDSAGFARLIYDRLTHKLGRDSVFFDVDDIPVGVDFVDILSERVGKCEALIAVIGRSWASSVDAHNRRRLDDPNDFVRIEIEAALAREVRVIPVLVDGAAMPGPDDLPDSLKKLAHRQGIEISHTRFDSDVDRLTRALSLLEEELRKREAAEAESAARVEGERREAEVSAARAQHERQEAENEAERRADQERRAREVAEAERVGRDESAPREAAGAEWAAGAQRTAETKAARSTKLVAAALEGAATIGPQTAPTSRLGVKNWGILLPITGIGASAAALVATWFAFVQFRPEQSKAPAVQASVSTPPPLKSPATLTAVRNPELVGLLSGWDKKGHDQAGTPAEQNATGDFYFHELDYAKAMEWYRKAANQGVAEAQHNVGMLYENGWGVTKDIC